MEDVNVGFAPTSEICDKPAEQDTPSLSNASENLSTSTVDRANNEVDAAVFQAPEENNGNQRIPPVDFPTNDNEIFMSTADFANANDPSQWDFLLSQGNEKHASHTASKWERESLYLKFDPLVKPNNQHEFAMPAAPTSNRNHHHEIREENINEKLGLPASNSPLISIFTPPVRPPNKQTCRRRGLTAIQEDLFRNPDIFLKPKLESNPAWDENVGDPAVTEPWFEENKVGKEEASRNTTYGSAAGDAEVISQETNEMPEHDKVNELQADPSSNEFFCPPPPKIANEVFVSSDIVAKAPDNAEWDMLIERGTGTEGLNRANKWERESLYQKFDPLVSGMSANTVTRPATSKSQPPLKERNKADIIEAANTKLVSVETPPSSQFRPRMIRSAAEHHHQSSYSEPTAPVVDFEKKKEMLTKKIEEGKVKFQAEMQKKSDRLKELENSIKSSSKEFEVQKKSGHSKKDYEKIITDLEAQISKIIRDITNARAERANIEDSRELASDELRQAEIAFSDLHGKYEKTKKLLSNFKENEQVLNNRYDAMQVKLDNRDGKLKRLQETAEDKLRSIKQDFGTSLKTEEMEINRLRAQSRKVELHLSTLEKDVEQKQIENKKLSQLCDDLIKGQGRP